MKTTQSVISRFENMGRLPSYDFFTRLALSLNHSPGMTLYGDYMAVVPHEKQLFIKDLADGGKISTKKFVQDLLEQCISKMNPEEFNVEIPDATASSVKEHVIDTNIIAIVWVLALCRMGKD